MDKVETPFDKVFRDLQQIINEDFNDWKDKLTPTAREEMDFRLKISVYLTNVLREVYNN